MAYAQLKNTALNGSGRSDASPGTIENRRETRLSADGTVCMILDHDGSEAVNGRLMDVSESGFRAVHHSPELTSGRVIRFHFEDRSSGRRRSGWARVVWSRVQDSLIESGCYIVIAD